MSCRSGCRCRSLGCSHLSRVRCPVQQQRRLTLGSTAAMAPFTDCCVSTHSTPSMDVPPGSADACSGADRERSLPNTAPPNARQSTAARATIPADLSSNIISPSILSDGRAPSNREQAAQGQPMRHPGTSPKSVDWWSQDGSTDLTRALYGSANGNGHPPRVTPLFGTRWFHLVTDRPLMRTSQ